MHIKKYVFLICLLALTGVYIVYDHFFKNPKTDFGLGYTESQCSPLKAGFIKGNTVVRFTGFDLDCRSSVYRTDFFSLLENTLTVNGLKKAFVPDSIIDIGEQYFIYVFFSIEEVELKIFKKCNDHEFIDVLTTKNVDMAEISKIILNKCN